LTLGAAATAFACASAPIRPESNQSPARPDPLVLADRLVLDGCYDCLLDARAAYQELAADSARPLVLQRLFETNILLALREKELAIPGDSSLARAAALARGLPASLRAQRYLDVVNLVPEDKVGAPAADRDAFFQKYPDALARVDRLIGYVEKDTLSRAFRQYATLSLHCSYLDRGRRPDPSPPLVSKLDAHLETAPPLVAYRLDSCWFPRRDPMERIREQVPRFAETDLIVGQMELPVVPYNGPAKARPFFEALYRRFPNSPTVTVLTGSLYESAGDCATALRYYRETTALRPRHERALLGQTVCLSALNQADSAIQTASRLIELGGSTEGKAFYWRAWNRYRLGNLPGAREDADSAKALEQTGEVLTLAGMIEHDQDQLDLAERDLDSALSQNGENCTALRFLGQVHYKRKQWPAAASRLGDATRCYGASAAGAERQLTTARAQTDWEPAFQAMRVAALETRAKEQRSQESGAAVNAAANYLRAGDVRAAQAYVSRAARDPERAAAVAELQEVIKKMTGPRR
jgi:tetratricopeptide (TPR) repeat protein